MENMEIQSSPTLIKTSLEAHSDTMNDIEQASFANLQSSMVLHAVSVFEAHNLLLGVYGLLWQSVQYLQCSSRMSHQPETCANSPILGTGIVTRQRGPPEPEPPAAPPIIILTQSGIATAPHCQVPDPADQEVQPKPLTSFVSLQTSPYKLETTGTSLHPPDKPEPEPNPAPPVIILTNENTPFASPPHSPTSQTSARPTTTSPPPPPSRAETHHPHTMGSKVSKVKENASNGKLQPSQQRLDKEQMKEPSNYYTHRSKSMRRKAGKTGSGVDAGGAQGGTAGGAGGAGLA